MYLNVTVNYYPSITSKVMPVVEKADIFNAMNLLKVDFLDLDFINLESKLGV